MPWLRPTPAEIRDRMAAEVAVALPGADARLRRSPETAIVRGVAIASHELHGHIAWATKQILDDTAEAEELVRRAAIMGITRKPAVTASGPVTLTGTAGAVLPAGTEFRRSDDARFVADADATIAGGGTATVTVTARVAGAAGNTAAGAALALIAPVPSILPSATTDGLGAGADAEGDEDLRARLMARRQAPPAGGAAADYRAWALAVPGVGSAWCVPLWAGAGTVGVGILAAGGALAGTPLINAVAAAIALLRPVTANVTVFTPTATTIPIILGISPDTTAVRTASPTAARRRRAGPGRRCC
ncbi:putative phage protein gp47/JayE [Humitalea rosea]|uniref:Putative phage protein gp47/JayE n=1 Tax=Humitalea rosea TaxID=990373 RepID=A0A2W7IIZ8_9PROT|nr:baseplate J/gp47 family protein [Humitalea rosea]PZW46845.1 putative phage protein gp47/JayE [Humitalea rosea]